jgi:hypothetical protein
MGLESYNEVPDLETDFASDEQVEDYRVKNEAIDTRLADIKSQLDALHRTDEISPAIDASELEHLLDTWDAAQQEKVHVSANYPGDWTLLLRDRVLDEATKTAFIAQRTAAMEHMKAGEPQTQEIGNKYGKRYATHYQNQIDAYDERVATIFASTNIENASAAHKHQLGFGAINDGGTIYSNAESRKTGPLTSRQKNIIEAHEKGHGLRDFESPTDTAEIRSVIDTKALETLMLARKEDSGEERFRPG